MSNSERKGSKYSSADRPTTISHAPKSLQHLEIHLDPFTIDGRTFRVFGTRSEPDHAHHVLCIETDERWWMPHDRVKFAQIKSGEP